MPSSQILAWVTSLPEPLAFGFGLLGSFCPGSREPTGELWNSSPPTIAINFPTNNVLYLPPSLRRPPALHTFPSRCSNMS
jgi:hypothetical protein